MHTLSNYNDTGILIVTPEADLSADRQALNSNFKTVVNTFVPYNGATGDVDLGSHSLTVGGSAAEINNDGSASFVATPGATAVHVNTPTTALNLTGLPTSRAGLSAGDLWLDASTGLLHCLQIFGPFPYTGTTADTAPASNGEAGSSAPTDGSGYYAFNIFGVDSSSVDHSSLLSALPDGVILRVDQVGGGTLGTLTYDAGSSVWIGSYLYFVVRRVKVLRTFMGYRSI